MRSRPINRQPGKWLDPANRGKTYSDNPTDPLWKIHVKFPSAKPMTEILRAPTQTAAVMYAQTKYGEEVKVTLLCRMDSTEGL